MGEVWLIGDWARSDLGEAVHAALAARGLTAERARRWPALAGPSALIAEDRDDWPAALARSRAAGWTGAALVLGARDAAAALDAGADDAVAVTAPAEEIAARTAARLRERRRELRVGALHLDRDRREASIGGEPLRLRPREWLLLERLALAGRAVSRAELLQLVFGLRIDPGTNVVAVHVSRLRAELARLGAAGLIQTATGGYRLRPLDPAANAA